MNYQPEEAQNEVIEVDQVHVIRHKVLSEGLSIRRVAREMGVSRNTVRKYLTQPEPQRRPEKERRKPVLGEVQERLDEVLEEWKDRTTEKQRVTGTRLHRHLVEEEGCQVGITTVRKYLREVRRQEQEVWIPLVHRIGDEAQVDFFEVTVDIDGDRRKAWMFLMRLMFSGRDFVWLYDRCDQVAFLDGHVRAFERFMGVPARGVYDNLKAAVRRHLIGSERQLTDRFKALVNHYQFEACFTRPRRGDDKGGVESRGKSVRLQHFTPIPQGKTLEGLAERRLAEVDRLAEMRVHEGQPVMERFAEEAKHLRDLPGASFEPRKVVVTEVSRKALVHVEGAYYSVPCTWKRLKVTALVGPNEVEIVCRGETVKRPRQVFGQRKVLYRDYLPELARKPQAVRQVAPELIAELGGPFGLLWELLTQTHGSKGAARVLAGVLAAVVEHGEERVTSAVEEALRTKKVDLLALAPQLHSVAQRRNPVPEGLASYVVESGGADDYDALLLEVGS